MSSYQLPEAVQLAQAGRRDEARSLLWQVVQIEPNNEVAWLWLATVAVDGTEYQRALNEVLRINPVNQQARQLLADFQRQQYAPQVQQPQPYPQQQPYMPYQQPGYQQPAYPQQPGYYAPAPKRKRRGCGGCTVGLFLLFLLPLIICCGLSYTSMSLGPVDAITGVFPGDFGRKEAKLEDDRYEITLTVPRSWYIADKDSNSWAFWRDILSDTVPFKDKTQDWNDSDVNLDTIQLENDTVLFLEGNPAVVRMAGTPVGMVYMGMSDSSDFGSFNCTDMRAANDLDEDLQLIEIGDGLCALRSDTVSDTPVQPTFDNVNAPDQTHTIQLIVPFEANRATVWDVYMSQNVYESLFDDDIEPLIESIDVNRK